MFNAVSGDLNGWARHTSLFPTSSYISSLGSFCSVLLDEGLSIYAVKDVDLLCLLLDGQSFVSQVSPAFIFVGWMGRRGLHHKHRVNDKVGHGGGGKRQVTRWMESEDKAEIKMLGLGRPNTVSLSPTQPNTVLGLLPFSLLPPPSQCRPLQHALAWHPLSYSTRNG